MDPACFEAQFFEGDSSRVSIIFVHGFAGSPYDFKPLVDRLRPTGARLLLPLTPDQKKGTFFGKGEHTPESLIEWLAGLIDAERAAGAEHVVLIGFSMGGLLAALVSLRGSIDQLVLLAPYFGLPTQNEFLTRYINVLAPVVPAVPKFHSGRIRDPKGRKRYQPKHQWIYTAALADLQELVVLGREEVRGLELPTLWLHAPEDPVACFRRAGEALPQLEVIELPQSDHVVLYDYDAERAIEAILAFLGPHLSAENP